MEKVADDFPPLSSLPIALSVHFCIVRNSMPALVRLLSYTSIIGPARARFSGRERPGVPVTTPRRLTADPIIQGKPCDLYETLRSLSPRKLL